MSSVAQAPRRSLRAPRVGRAQLGIELLPLFLLTILALILRASQLHQSLLGDEVFSYRDIAGRSFGAVLSTVHTGGENSPPLFFLLAWMTAKLGDATVWLRLPSVLLGAATVPVVYLVGRESVGRAAGLIAAGVMAVAPFAIYYGVEARPYASMTFFVAVSTLAVLRAVHDGHRGWWAIYVLAATAAAYSHYTCVFALAAQAAWLLWTCRRRIGVPLLANLLIALLYLPWLPHLRGKALAVIGALYPLGFHRVVTDLLRPIPGHPSAPLSAIPTLTGLLVFAAIVLAGLVAAGVRVRSSRERPRREIVLIVVLMAATPVGLLLYSLLDTDLWLPRGLSASMPATALVLGALVRALPRPAATLAVVALGVILVAGTARSLGPDYDRGPYREIAAYLDRLATPADPVVIGTYAGAGPIEAQVKHPHRIVRRNALWRAITPGRTGYLVLDAVLAQVLHISEAPAPGFIEVTRRHWGGGLPIDVVGYRRAG